MASITSSTLSPYGGISSSALQNLPLSTQMQISTSEMEMNALLGNDSSSGDTSNSLYNSSNNNSESSNNLTSVLNAALLAGVSDPSVAEKLKEMQSSGNNTQTSTTTGGLNLLA